jgi:hypothetical protein
VPLLQRALSPENFTLEVGITMTKALQDTLHARAVHSESMNQLKEGRTGKILVMVYYLYIYIY